MAFQPYNFFRNACTVGKNGNFLQQAFRLYSLVIFFKQVVNAFAQTFLVFFHNLRRTCFYLQKFFFNQRGALDKIAVNIAAFRFAHGNKVVNSLLQSLFKLRPNGFHVKKALFNADNVRAARKVQYFCLLGQLAAADTGSFGNFLQSVMVRRRQRPVYFNGAEPVIYIICCDKYIYAPTVNTAQNSFAYPVLQGI